MTDDLARLLRSGAKFAVLVGVSLVISFAGIALIQGATDVEEVWDTGSFWPFALGSGLLLGALFARSGRAGSGFYVGAVFAACVVAASVALSEDDEGANFGAVAVVVVWPWLTLVAGLTAWLGGYAVAWLTAEHRRD
ncbi:MAG: hypothetical protein ACXWZ8_10510 [Gaiellaceae bacterium]